MRHYQRGIATSIILIIFLIMGVAIASGFFVFYQNQQKLKSIDSFEDCAEYYPVMESYPEQCNTPDGKHFTRELSDKEKSRLSTQPNPSPSKPADPTLNWNTYQSAVIGLSLKYPPSWSVKEEDSGRVVNIFSPVANENFPEINIVLTENFPHSENPDYEYMSEAKEIEVGGYKATIREDQDSSLPRAGGFGYIQSVEIEYGEDYLIYLTAEKNSPIFPEVLRSIKLSGLE